MDHYRFIQILQDILNSQNSTINTLNSFLQEAQSSSYSSYSESDYNILLEQNNNLKDQVAGLNNTIGGLQSGYETLIGQLNSGSASQSAEISALRNLLDAVTAERDSLSQQVSEKNATISNLESHLSEKDTAISSYTSTTSEHQYQISDLNNKLTAALSEIHEKNQELLLLEEKVALLQQSLVQAKARIAAELEEAKSDIDSALQSVVISPADKPASTASSGYTAVPFIEVTRFLKGTNVSISDVLCKGVLYQDAELTVPSPNEGGLTLNGVSYATDESGIIRISGTTCK